MAAFAYRAATLEGKLVEGTMEAPDSAVVSLKLQEMGLLPIRVDAASRKTLLTRDIPWPW